MAQTRVSQLGAMVSVSKSHKAVLTQLGAMVTVSLKEKARVSQLGAMVSVRVIHHISLTQMGVMVSVYGVPSPNNLTATYVAGSGILLQWTTPRESPPNVYKGIKLYRVSTQVVNGVPQNVTPTYGTFIPIASTQFMDRQCEYPPIALDRNKYTYWATTCYQRNDLILVDNTGIGSYRLIIKANGQEVITGDIPANATTKQLQDILQTAIGVVNIQARGNIDGGPYTLHWTGTYINSNVAIDVDSSNLDDAIKVEYISTIKESGLSNSASATFLG